MSVPSSSLSVPSGPPSVPSILSGLCILLSVPNVPLCVLNGPPSGPERSTAWSVHSVECSYSVPIVPPSPPSWSVRSADHSEWSAERYDRSEQSTERSVWSAKQSEQLDLLSFTNLEDLELTVRA